MVVLHPPLRRPAISSRRRFLWRTLRFKIFRDFRVRTKTSNRTGRQDREERRLAQRPVNLSGAEGLRYCGESYGGAPQV
jgi:hypothetical protein